MQYSLLTHLRGVADHARSLARIIAAWDELFDIPILSFSSRGPGRQPDQAFLDQHARFGPLANEMYVKLRESRKRIAPMLEVWFTNPARAFYGDLNYVAVTLPDGWLPVVGSAQAEHVVVEFVRLLETIGTLCGCSFEREDVTLQSPGVEVLRAIAAEYGWRPGHISYFNQRILNTVGGIAGLNRAGFIVRVAWSHGCLAGLPIESARTSVEWAWELFDALEALGLFRRGVRAAALDLELPKMSEIGDFLGTFEERFGHAFAARYSDGLRRAGSA